MVKRDKYNVDGTYACPGDYDRLKVDDDAFQKKVKSVLDNLTAVPELTTNPTVKESRRADEAITRAINELEVAFSERKV
jgi:hypothetical protein